MRLVKLLSATLLTMGPAVSAIEKPKHTVIQTFGDFELRQVPSYLVAETRVEGNQGEAGNEGFRRLAGYIFGKNQGGKKMAMTAPVTMEAGTKIAMTAPVQQTQASGAYVVQFMMPSSWTLQTLPRPLDERVVLKEMPPRQMAALTYSGIWSEARYQSHLNNLRKALNREGLKALGEPVWARYDAPWTPWFLRTNEILVEVASIGSPSSLSQ
ncbi:MAG: heme-binding protein [Holophaga sp.]|nr:heme-binding protein [Holophaga sp.]